MPLNRSVDTDTMLLRAGYFLFYTSLAFMYPYLPLLYKATGFNESMIGVLNSLYPMSALIVVPLWTYIADKFHAARTIFVPGECH